MVRNIRIGPAIPERDPNYKREHDHSPEEIRDYIVENYQGLSNALGVSIGKIAHYYNVIVTDSQHWNHTLNISPQEIDDYQKAQKQQPAIDGRNYPNT